MIRYVPVTVVVLGLLLSASAGAARAQNRPLADVDLDRNRGGFIVAGDVAFEFGAMVRTYENGELALQTSVTWTATGAVVDRLAGAGVVGAGTVGGIGSGSAYTTASGASVVHNVGAGQLANILMNPTSQANFRQETNATLVLPRFQAVQGDIGRGLASMRIADDVSLGSIGALGQ